MSYRSWIILALILVVLTGCALTLSTDPQAGAPAASAITAQLTPGAAPPDVSGGPGQPEAERCTSAIPGACATENMLAMIVQYLTFFAELCGAFVIAVAVVRALLRFLPYVAGHPSADEPYKEDIRLQLGKSLALALEFELGADILKTAVAPSFTVIAQLAAIIVLRTLLNYFLERELRQSEQRRAGQHLAAAPQRGEAGQPDPAPYRGERDGA